VLLALRSLLKLFTLQFKAIVFSVQLNHLSLKDSVLILVWPTMLQLMLPVYC